MSQIRGAFVGTIIADTVQLTDPNDAGDRWMWGEFGDLGWSCRFSVPLSSVDDQLRGTLEQGTNVPATFTGICIAEVARSGAILKVKATSVAALEPLTLARPKSSAAAS